VYTGKLNAYIDLLRDFAILTVGRWKLIAVVGENRFVRYSVRALAVAYY